MWWQKRRAAEDELLIALLAGAVLKAHRTVDGSKEHWLHNVSQAAQLKCALFENSSSGKKETYCFQANRTVVAAHTVRRLEAKALIQSNMKFPAATYLLTAKGAALARRLSGRHDQPLTVRRPAAGDTHTNTDA